MSLATARQAVATALTPVVPGFRARPLRQPKAGDGWVVVNRVEPSGYGHTATLTAFVVLGADDVHAEDLVESLSVPMLTALRDLPVHGVAAEPVQIAAGTGNLYALAITMTTEV